jgi:hypothetical protein
MSNAALTENATLRELNNWCHSRYGTQIAGSVASTFALPICTSLEFGLAA